MELCTRHGCDCSLTGPNKLKEVGDDGGIPQPVYYIIRDKSKTL